MSSTIRILSDKTINQIAAGEVIENPASVVKELVENSLDAGATRILVEMTGGGLGLIRVSDNGSGMNAADARLSLERHATSKIRDAEDLFKIQTMGFRGEALASIAAISLLTLATSDGSREGTRIEAHGGEIIHEGDAARSLGTTVEARSLFYNVPARKKFQKSARQRLSEATLALTKLALAHPFCLFELLHEGRRHLYAPPSDSLFNRTKELLGEPFSSSPFSVSIEEKEFSLKGMLASPLESRTNRSGQHLFINGRSVLCLALSYAVKEGFGTRLESDRFPLFVLHLHLLPSALDINVHPQKKEVRLKEESLLKERMRTAVIESLSPAPLAQERAFAPLFFSSAAAFSVTQQGLRFKEEAPPELLLDLPFRECEPLGTVNAYLLLKKTASSHEENDLLIVDLLAARARILFETLAASEKKVESQALLLPLTLTCTKAEMELFSLQAHLLEKAGFEVRAAGETALLVEAFPSFLKEEELKDLLLDLAQELRPSGIERERKLAALASRLARGGKKSFSLLEAVRLYEALLKSSDPSHCPLGRAIQVALPLKNCFG